MGGGSLLDVGIYCLAPMVSLAGRPPKRVAATAVRALTGVDASFAGWLDFGSGLAGAFDVSFEAPERQLLEITGTEARLRMERAFTGGPDDTEIELAYRDGTIHAINCGGNDPYLAMVEHFNAVVQGKEAPLRTPEDSIEVMSLLDMLRATATVST
jgi:predicted dehydrogenase